MSYFNTIAIKPISNSLNFSIILDDKEFTITLSLKAIKVFNIFNAFIAVVIIIIGISFSKSISLRRSTFFIFE
jgi:hypothetical protein